MMSTQTFHGDKQGAFPFAQASSEQVRQFCDYMGVTNRYNGYRNNLNRGFKDNGYAGSRNGCDMSLTRQPLNASTFRPQSVPLYQTNKQRTGTMKSLEVKHSGSFMNRGMPTKSIQEQCGINTTFPGRTEYMCRYSAPPLDRPTRPFTINPTPNYYSIGRPLAHPQPIYIASEYQSRYTFPDGKMIKKLPWRT